MRWLDLKQGDVVLYDSGRDKMTWLLLAVEPGDVGLVAVWLDLHDGKILEDELFEEDSDMSSKYTVVRAGE